MTKKIFHSIFTVALVVLLASIGIATSFLYDYFNDSQVKQLKAELSLVADTVNNIGVEYFENFDSTMPISISYLNENKVVKVSEFTPFSTENNEIIVKKTPCIFGVKHFSIKFERQCAFGLKQIKIIYKL